MNVAEMLVEAMQNAHRVFQVDLPDDWDDPFSDPETLPRILETAAGVGADWVLVVHKGEGILSRPTNLQ